MLLMLDGGEQRGDSGRVRPCVDANLHRDVSVCSCVTQGGLLSGDDTLDQLLHTMKPLHKGRKRLAGRREREREGGEWEREREIERGNPLFFQGLNTLRVYSVSGARRHISTSISF